MKHCSGCSMEKPLAAFHRRSSAKDGHQARCKECQKQYVYRWRAANPAADAVIAKRHYEKSGRARQYQRLYGVPLEVVEALLADQGHCCAICGRPVAESYHGLHLDHDHLTGGVRGLLCHFCNTALGKFGDSPYRLATAIAYLDRYDASRPD